MIDSILQSTAMPNLHPALVRFPIALLITAVGFDFVAIIFRRFTWLDRTAVALYVLGTLGALAAYMAGDEAADAMTGLPPHVLSQIAAHSQWAIYTLIFFGVFTLTRFAYAWRRRRDTRTRLIRFRVLLTIVGALGLGLLAKTADLGGSLVFEHGVAVSPETDDATETTPADSSQINTVDLPAADDDMPAELDTAAGR